MRFPIIETERLILRMYEQEDLETVYLMTYDPDIERFSPDPNRQSREEILASLPQRLEPWEKLGFGQFGVFEKTTGKLIGYCGLKFLEGTADVEVYYGFFREYWGKGLASEAAAAALRFGFEEAHLVRIVGVVHIEHTASQRVLEKIGLTREKRAFFYGMDVFCFSLERRDYNRPVAEYLLRYREIDDR